jgi:hypothetical protein
MQGSGEGWGGFGFWFFLGVMQQDLNQMINLTKEVLSMCPDVKYASLNDLWFGLLRLICDDLMQAKQGEQEFTSYNLIDELNAEKINHLHSDLDDYDAKSSLKKMLGGVPKSFKEYLQYTNSKDIDRYSANCKKVLSTIGTILSLSGVGSIKDLIKISKGNIEIPVGKLGVVATDSEKIEALIEPVAKLISLFNLFHFVPNSFGEAVEWLTSTVRNLTLLKNIKNHPDNKRLALTKDLKTFIDMANRTATIKAQEHKKQGMLDKKRQLLEDSFGQTSQYLAGNIEISDYLNKAKEATGFIRKHQKDLHSLLDSVNLPDDNRPIDGNLNAIQDSINKANLANYFSNHFFELHQGQTVALWLNTISALETYNNDAEMADFIVHNKTINDIRDALGSANQKYIDDVLSIDDISFEVFAARIVNVLINESFGRVSIMDKRHISTKDIVEKYHQYLKNRKFVEYHQNLCNIRGRSLSTAKELAKQNILQQGGTSTMDRYRHNTALILESFPIVCATPKEVAKYLAPQKAIFDYVIFDEASQLLPGQALPSIYRAKRAIIIGDPHQMPPGLNASLNIFEQSEDEFEDLGESILDLVKKQPQQHHHLKVHYRSQYNKLFEPSREAIYRDDGIEPIFEAELANGAPIDIIDDLGDDIDDDGYDKNFHKVCESVNKYLEQDPNADFCILFARSDVLAKFKDFMAEVGEREYGGLTKLYDTDKVLLSTVTNCQGIEGAYTIIYLNHYSAPGAMWFFKETAGAYKRLNVAITRQRKGLKLLLANQKSLWIKTCDEKISRKDTGPNAKLSAELMKSLLSNAGEISDTTYLDRTLGRNIESFDSPLTEQLYYKLTSYYEDKIGREIKIYGEVGWHLLIPAGEGIDMNERNVGFRIDLGVYSVPKKKFILGIEMDGAMYHSGFDKEQSDYNRQKVLESKGWELYRIWSTNWLNDIDREFNRLVEKINERLK